MLPEKVAVKEVKGDQADIKPEAGNEVTPANNQPETIKANEILKRFSEEPESKQANENELAELKNVNLDDIKDPESRAFVERRVKELESGVNKKFEEIAQKRKELEAKLAEANQPWTPQRIQSLLKDQNFLASVQELQGSSAPPEWEGSQEDWSSLSPREKQEFDNLRRENRSTSQQVQHLLQSLENEKLDKQLKEKYPNYDSKVVDDVQKGLMNGTIQATREDLWKVANYERDVERAYRLGLKDRNGEISDKLNAGQTLNGINTKTTTELPEEVKKGGITSILKYRLAQSKKS